MSPGNPREEAERWFARLMAPDCSRREREAFQRWREQSAAHAQAYVATEDLLGRVDALAASDPRMQALLDRARAANVLESRDSFLNVRRWARPVALAASLAVIAVAAYIGLGRVLGTTTPPTVYTTQAETQVITLSDGTVAQLDVHSTMTASITARARRIEVRAGRVLFAVTHDRVRPFTVKAGRATITDVGTRFQVDRVGDRVAVTLAEGAVNVTPDVEPGAAPHGVNLVPGQQLVYSADLPAWTTVAVDAEALMSWAHGRLVFHGTRLAEVIGEVNRYAPRKILIADPTLSDLPVQGNFLLGDSEAVIAALAAVLPLQAQRDDTAILLYRRK
jgi:transmembrane sensor